MKKVIFIALTAIFLFKPYKADAAQVLATIKPIHSILTYLTQNSSVKPELLVTGPASPHGYQLKPSQLQQVKNAVLIFYIDPSFETFIAKALETTNAQKIQLSEMSTIDLMPVRGKDETIKDMHFFLSPDNAKIIASKMMDVLAEKYPEEKKEFNKNYRKFLNDNEKLKVRIKSRLSSVRDKPFVSFHDSLQYFERYFGLNEAASFTIDPHHPLKPAKLAEIELLVKERKIVCILSEKRFSDKVVKNLIAGTDIKNNTIDPEGTSLKPSKDMYFNNLDNLSAEIKDCLRDDMKK